jgi:hypothetical protein
VSAVIKKQPRRRSSTSTRTSPVPAIDREKLRAAVRRLGDEYIFHLLDDAIDLLPAAKLAKLVSRYLDVKPLRPDAPGKRNVLADVRAFDAASRSGKYYESFNVNSKNYMDKSTGTRAFIADCNRLLERCVTEASKGDAAEIGEAIEIVLGLLRYIGECNDDVIFFADEGGSWQVGVDWAEVLPALFSCLSRTTEPQEYVRRVVAAVDEFDECNRVKHLAAARRLATPLQRRAMQEENLSSRT